MGLQRLDREPTRGAPGKLAMNPAIYQTVERWIPEKSRVLDLGTGDGAFLEQLIQNRRVVGEGVEKDAALAAR